jgi:hypothetical protein
MTTVGYLMAGSSMLWLKANPDKKEMIPAIIGNCAWTHTRER